MDANPVVTRRAVLAAGTAGAGAVVLAACSTGGSSNSPLAGNTPTGGSSASASSGVALAKLDDIVVGQAVSAKLPDGTPAIIARPTATTAAAFSAICTHMGCTVNPAGKQLHCPCHGSRYDATTGAVIQGPAPKPLPPIAVHVDGGEVVTGAS
jgi:cytochrome b6-f complex iron-sulfur subunit